MIITSSKAPMASFQPAQQAMDLMQKDFGFPLKDRMIIIPEVDRFRIKEDESITAQVKSEKYEYEVYFDGEFVCGFSVAQHPQRVRIEILKGLKQLILDNKIYFDKKKYELEAEEIKKAKIEKRERLERIAKQFTSPEEKLVVAAIEKHVGRS